MTNIKFILKIMTLCLVVRFTKAAKVLVLSMQVHSHIHEGLAIGEELVTRGHRVYLALSTVTETPQIAAGLGIGILTYRSSHNDTSYYTSDWLSQGNINSFFHYSADRKSAFYQKLKITRHQDCIDMMADNDFVKTIGEMNFDLALVDRCPLAICLPVLPFSLGIPFVTVGSNYDYWLMRVPSLPSVSPIKSSAHLLPDRDYTSYFNRIRNTLFMLYKINFIDHLRYQDSSLIEQYAKSDVDKSRTWIDIQRSALLFMINLEPILDSLHPGMPNTIFVGGLTCRPARPLPDHIKEVMDTARHGVILFTLGSLTNDLPEDVNRKFATAFAGINQTVIWKRKNQLSFPVSSNVKVLKWLPQNDILGHNQTKLFITHSGNNGQYEALYHSVPMLAFYLFGDQYYNALRIQSKGFGDMLSFKTFTANDLIDSINRILSDETYHKNIAKASQMYRDYPMNARQKAAHWIEHVLKFGGKHLRPLDLDMQWYQFSMVDVICTFMVVLLFLMIGMIYTLRIIASTSTYLLCKLKLKIKLD